MLLKINVAELWKVPISDEKRQKIIKLFETDE